MFLDSLRLRFRMGKAEGIKLFYSLDITRLYSVESKIYLSILHCCFPSLVRRKGWSTSRPCRLTW